MQFSLTLILTSILSLTQALPSGIAVRGNQQIADAQNSWRADTSMVSQFLSSVPTLRGAELQSAAQVALNAEIDELTHKKVLDGVFSSDPRIVQANNILVNQGTFQSVVDALQSFTDDGASMSEAEITTLLRNTNTVRCGQVLPAIDTYFRVAGERLNNGVLLLATRPNNC
ncbi:hypothetical protein F5B22DRAFT_596317 [Xylaria bambusicola]|uniref:uncharacterized protein n=1 Tax=Xylaria bambusicola TaxID=326684 RepID=UPI002008CB5B|nr:uncharacterized protein F5B22DRAFT_596317 [Xylaria bambusicola]KAI0521256.1 hypothetical protein F5B22DRAFT_596317 [Xylaria bambusicola]